MFLFAIFGHRTKQSQVSYSKNSAKIQRARDLFHNGMVRIETAFYTTFSNKKTKNTILLFIRAFTLYDSHYYVKKNNYITLKVK